MYCQKLGLLSFEKPEKLGRRHSKFIKEELKCVTSGCGGNAGNKEHGMFAESSSHMFPI